MSAFGISGFTFISAQTLHKKPMPAALFRQVQGHGSFLDTSSKKLLCGSGIRDLVAIGEGLEESDEGIFFLVRKFEIAELSFVEIG
jgi:hypothetical protein